MNNCRPFCQLRKDICLNDLFHALYNGCFTCMCSCLDETQSSIDNRDLFIDNGLSHCAVYCQLLFFIIPSYFIYVCNYTMPFYHNRIDSVMVSVLASSAVYRGIEPRSGQTKYYAIGISCFISKHAALRRKNIYYISLTVYHILAHIIMYLQTSLVLKSVQTN